MEIGEMVVAKLALRRQQKGKVKKQKRKLAPRCIEAVWVGQIARSGEHIVIKANGDAVRCRTIKRVLEQHRWNVRKYAQSEAHQGVPHRPRRVQIGWKVVWWMRRLMLSKDPGKYAQNLPRLLKELSLELGWKCRKEVLQK